MQRHLCIDFLSTDLPLAPRSGVAAGFLRSVEARCGVRVRGGARGPLHGLFMLQVKLGTNTHGGEPVTRKEKHPSTGITCVQAG